MFEDIEDSLHGKRPRRDDDEDSGPTKRFNSGGDRYSRDDIEDEVSEFIKKKFGGKAIRVPGGLLVSGDDTHKEIFDKIEGLVKSLAYLAEELKIPFTCKDTNGEELVEGDVLKVPGGEIKTVLKVGWKFAMLSHTDDQKKADGMWFEDEINKLNFIKRKNDV